MKYSNLKFLPLTMHHPLLYFWLDFSFFFAFSSNVILNIFARKIKFTLYQIKDKVNMPTKEAMQSLFTNKIICIDMAQWKRAVPSQPSPLRASECHKSFASLTDRDHSSWSEAWSWASRPCQRNPSMEPLFAQTSTRHHRYQGLKKKHWVC